MLLFFSKQFFFQVDVSLFANQGNKVAAAIFFPLGGGGSGGGGGHYVTLGETRNGKGPHTINAANVGTCHTHYIRGN